MTTPIPQPRSIPFFGNVTAIDKDVPLHSFVLLAEQYGPIYQLDFFGNKIIYIGSYELVNEVSDEKRFEKLIGRNTSQLRSLVGDGLFTARSEEPNWGIAHRLLMPAFGAASIRDMFDDMADICGQLVQKWERFGPEHRINTAEDFSKTAFDAIALCSMSHRLNSFYTENQPPFVNAMTDWLRESFNRTTRAPIVQPFLRGTNQKYEDDQELMISVAKKILEDRRENPIEKDDLLSKMLFGKDPKTGEGLSDESIIRNLLTFLVAGHETSSGTMAFTLYLLLKHPNTLRKLRQEVDEVLGDEPAKVEDLSKLHYLNAAMRESLRLHAPTPVRNVAAIEDTVLHSKEKTYEVKKGQQIVVLVHQSHRDTSVWGPDANEFKPERMLDEKFRALPPNAWQPFGFGIRGCIGRPFAWQEMLLVLSTIIQRFDITFADPSYTLEIQQALTVKPKDFYVCARPRKDKKIHTRSVSTPRVNISQPVPGSSLMTGGKHPLYVLYGSNGGTSGAFAQRLARDAPAYGFRPKISVLDSVTGHLPTDGPVVIVTASYEGQPADNAAQFFDWLVHLPKSETAKNIRYAVFGCGNHDWATTYQRIPIMVDNLLEEHGGSRIILRGEGDSSQGDFFQVFEDFQRELWETLSQEFQTSKIDNVAALQVKTVDSEVDRTTILRQTNFETGRIIENRLLSHSDNDIKRHIEIELPKGMTYRAGDYLSIIPENPPRDVHRVLRHFGFTSDQSVIITSEGPTTLPIGIAVNVSVLLSGYVEFSQPATKNDVQALLSASTDENTSAKLKVLLESHQDLVFTKRVSILDILETHSGIRLAFGAYLHLLPPMRVRQYSISSSPLWNPAHVTLTVSVVAAPALSGREELFLGVASNYLASLRPGDKIQLSMRASAAAFHLPADPITPVVMFAAGSGLAPMRGFIQERSVQKVSGRDVGAMLLFFGCHDPEIDYLYADAELGQWIADGVVDVRPAFSRKEEVSAGCKYVQDRIWYNRKDVSAAYSNGAQFYTCGSGKAAAGIKSSLRRIVAETHNLSSDEAAAAEEKMARGRYATDVFD